MKETNGAHRLHEILAEVKLLAAEYLSTNRKTSRRDRIGGERWR
jgi:hypothetical protein